MEPMNWDAETAADLRAVRATLRGPRAAVGTDVTDVPCWEQPGAALHCWKFLDPDPGDYDFLMLLTIRRVPPANSAIALFVPDADGGLLHFQVNPTLKTVQQTTIIRTISTSHGDFGPVSVSKLTARVYHEEVSRTVFGTEFRRGKYDRNRNLIEPHAVVKGGRLPPLPVAVDPVAALGPAAAVEDESLGAIRFAVTAELPDGDFEVDGGTDEPATQLAAAGDGSLTIHIEFKYQENPPLSLMISSVVGPNRPARTFAVDYCFRSTREQFRERVFVKKRSSWFRKKTRIRVVRTELKTDELKCGTLS